MSEIDIFTFSKLLEKKDIQQKETKEKLTRLAITCEPDIRHEAEIIHAPEIYLLDTAYASETQKLVEPLISEAVQQSEVLEEFKKLPWARSLTSPKLDVLLKPSEKTIDKLLDVLSQKDKMIAMLKFDLEKNDEEFAQMLDRILVGFISIFAVMVYLFLIK